MKNIQLSKDYCDDLTDLSGYELKRMPAEDFIEMMYDFFRLNGISLITNLEKIGVIYLKRGIELPKGFHMQRFNSGNYKFRPTKLEELLLFLRSIGYDRRSMISLLEDMDMIRVNKNVTRKVLSPEIES